MEIAIRHNISKQYTSKDYIQEGLAAQWDGIENAGYNRHEETVAKWKDLVGNCDLPLTDVYQDSTFYSGAQRTAVKVSYDGDLTFGGRFAYSGTGWQKWCYLGIGRDSGNLNGLCISGTSDGFTCRYQDRYSTPLYSTCVRYDGATVGDAYTCYVVFHHNEKSFDFYVNGKLVGSHVIDPNYWNLNGKDVELGYGLSYDNSIPEKRYNALVYDRALEPWEISHNYDIDLKRFEYNAHRN